MENIKIEESAKVIGKVRFGDGSYIAQGTIVRSESDSVTLGNSSWVLENSVVIGENSIVEAGSIVCDYSILGGNCLVKSGSLVKQRDEFKANSIIEGFPGKSIGENENTLETPDWSIR